MKILFVMASAEYLRYYDSTIRLLASRGHDVAIAVNDHHEKKPVRLDGTVGVEDARITVIGVLPRRPPWWGRVAKGLRAIMDFVRYYDPHFADAHILRARIKRKVLPRAFHCLDRVRSLSRRRTRQLLRALAMLEEAIPGFDALERVLREVGPDVVLVSPLVDAASRQVDLVRSARRLGIPTAVGIASWDNLTNKGVLRIEPDLVIVWNEIQKREAVELHGIPPEKVAVTGAQPFDRWFQRQPARGLEEFCRRVGLAKAAPFVLFTGSSGFISEGHAEVEFVRSWIRALRQSGDPALRSAPILVRPHPYNAWAWADADVSDLDGVGVWPAGPYNPVDEINRADFFDSLYHSAAVVGINTSAMIEAAIVGRPVFSILAPEFAGTQEGTLHFHYLRPENGGFLRIAGSLEEHVRQLAGVLNDARAAREETARFVDSFIRPHGLDRPCTPIVADAIEALGARRVTPQRPRWWAYALRPIIWPVAALSALWPAVTSRRWRSALKKSWRMRWHRMRKTLSRATSVSADRRARVARMWRRWMERLVVRRHVRRAVHASSISGQLRRLRSFARVVINHRGGSVSRSDND